MNSNSSYNNSSVFIKILAWLTVVAFGFVLFNMVMLKFNYVPKPALGEIYFTLQNGIPLFLFLVGTCIKNKHLKIPLLIFFPIFIICYFTNVFNNWDVINLRGRSAEILKWVMGISLACLFLTYFIHFIFKKAKNLFNFLKEKPSLLIGSPFIFKLGQTVLDLLKLSWFFSIGYALICMKFPIGFYGLTFFNLSIYLFPFLMGIGLFRYFRKSRFL
jgi:hypothetical protein